MKLYSSNVCILTLSYYVYIIHATDISIGECMFPKHNENSQRTGLKRLKNLVGEKFSVTKKGVRFTLSICKSLDDHSAGITQYIADSNLTFDLGKVSHTDIYAGDEWLFLEYGSGDKRKKTCGAESRRSIIMITCSKKKDFRYIEENAKKNINCYYLFELEHPQACTTPKSNRSAGSIICIIFFSFAIGYLVFGVLFMRIIRGQKGANMIPNLIFWQRIGNYIADAVDFLCRCNRSSHNGLSAGSPREYRPVENHYTGNEESTVIEQPDDHLLSL